jgi:hypothetical protein
MFDVGKTDKLNVRGSHAKGSSLFYKPDKQTLLAIAI